MESLCGDSLRRKTEDESIRRLEGELLEGETGGFLTQRRERNGILHSGWTDPALIFKDFVRSYDNDTESISIFLPDEPYHEESGRPQRTEAYPMSVWYKDGRRHREQDLPAVVYGNGVEEWWSKGKLHRDSGPAVIRPSGTKEYWCEGRRPRLDGPAIEGGAESEYWIDGKRLSAEEFQTHS